MNAQIASIVVSVATGIVFGSTIAVVIIAKLPLLFDSRQTAERVGAFLSFVTWPLRMGGDAGPGHRRRA
jgi:hypothetical protein